MVWTTHPHLKVRFIHDDLLSAPAGWERFPSMQTRVQSAPMSSKSSLSAFDALYADLAALPENRVGEIVDGVLYSFPRPALPHRRAQGRVFSQLDQPADDDSSGVRSPMGRWILLFEPELHIAGDVLVPDIAGWRRERMPELPETANTKLPPDWVCEVLSPSTAAHDRKRKLPRYAAMGVPHLWLVDPAAKCIEVFALTTVPDAGQRYALMATHADDEKTAIPPFEDVAFDVGALWRR